MTSNINDFNLKLGKISAEISETEFSKLVRYILLMALRGVVLKSPVGNPDLWKSPPPKGYVGGQFRSNWQLSMGAGNPSEEVKSIKSADQVIGEISAQISSITDPYQIFHLVNNLPYAMRLENGWSTQAPGPGGIVMKTIEEIRNANPDIFKE